METSVYPMIATPPGPWVLDAQPACSHLMPMENGTEKKALQLQCPEGKSSSILFQLAGSCLPVYRSVRRGWQVRKQGMDNYLVARDASGAPDVWVLGLNNRRWIPRTVGVSFFSGSSPKDAATLLAKSIVALLGIKPCCKASDSWLTPARRANHKPKCFAHVRMNHFGMLPTSHL